VPDTPRRLETLEPSQDSQAVREVRVLADIHLCAGDLDQFGEPLQAADPVVGVVETRRLELLTLSLQRRCSSN
jgi:hypothetical protein